MADESTVGDLLKEAIDYLEENVVGSAMSDIVGVEAALCNLEEIQIVLGEYKLDNLLDLSVREDTSEHVD